MQTEALMEKQRSFFDSGKTLDISFRVRALDRLEQSLLACEDRLYAALRKDLGKSRAEAYMCEIGLTLSELRLSLIHI